MIKSYEHKDFAEDDIEGIHDFIAQNDIVEGGEQFYAIVAEVWPHLLHKVKPPRSLMH